MVIRMSEKVKSCLLGLSAGVVNGLLGSGGGTILVPFMQNKLKVEQHKSHATTVAVVAPLCLVSALFYMGNQAMDWWVLLAVSVGGVIGGVIGAKVLNKISGKWLHFLFGGLMMASAVRMLL